MQMKHSYANEVKLTDVVDVSVLPEGMDVLLTPFVFFLKVIDIRIALLHSEDVTNSPLHVGFLLLQFS